MGLYSGLRAGGLMGVYSGSWVGFYRGKVRVLYV